MLPEERLTQIYNTIVKTKAVKIDELAQFYDVTTMTIRRDLDKLTELYSNVKRCHGGAVLSIEIDSEEEFENKQNLNVTEKSRIAKAAFDLISENDTIYLDAGTTTLELAKLIAVSHLHLNVMTNDLEIAKTLRNCNCEVLLTGGVLQKATGCLVGSFAEEFISKVKFKIAFMGATAINEKFEVLTPSIEKRTIKPLVLRHASKSYLLADDDKFDKNSTYVIYPLTDFTGVITTKKFTEQELKQMENLGINIIGLS